MQGRIVKGIAGFYYVYVERMGLYECKAKGVFRNRKWKPLVGDRVSIDLLSEDDKEGNIIDILPRTSELIRPNVANIDQAFIVFALTHPEPNLNLLDRFLIGMERQQVPTVICFNKTDLVCDEEQDKLLDIYKNCGCKVFFSSVYEKEGIEEIRQMLRGKTTAFAGPSGVGKSSLFNCLSPDFKMETGAVSEKIKRGKHTTRHTELIPIEEDTFIMDTPGFSSFYIDELEKEELKDYFYEFIQYEPYCKFQGCVHINEPVCGVKDAVSEGKISRSRYENYKLLYEELKDKKRW
ncbi:MAG: ribosome small subunit-dependent GTPase A [Lachnospiraceae bacterium]|nr:ribosome small subunit-dependent GTPase A [Lachnospiraceae bacterium]